MNSISDLAAHCIRCGFCLESCPTFVVTGKETESPRGRIYLIRSADAGAMEWTDPSIKEHIDTCVGCRACETACPSGVEYGPLLEMARQKLDEAQPARAKGLLLKGITSPRLLKMQLALGKLTRGRRMPRFLSRMLSGQAAEVDKPEPQSPSHWPPLNEEIMPPVKGQLSLLMGCAMSVLFQRVHVATKRLLRRVGYETVEIHGCCGALHAHNGQLSKAIAMASSLRALGNRGEETEGRGQGPWERAVGEERASVGARREEGQRPLIVNSAGCGSFLKEQDIGEVKDISEFLFENGLLDLLKEAEGPSGWVGPPVRVTYHDACHLAHGQGIRSGPRELLKAIPGLDYVELQEADMCCGSGGIYNLTEPHLARKLLERKWGTVLATGAQIVVSGNPGCHAWIEQRSREGGGTIRVMHTAELLERAFVGDL